MNDPPSVMDSELKISAEKFNSQSTISYDTEQAISPIGNFNRVTFCDSSMAFQRSLPEELKLSILRLNKKICLGETKLS